MSVHTNEYYARKFLAVSTLEVRNRDHLDFHEIGVESLYDMIAVIAKDELKDLSLLSMENIVLSRTGQTFTNDGVEFYEMAVWSINDIINDVRNA